jgi:hypothetical protein
MTWALSLAARIDNSIDQLEAVTAGAIVYDPGLCAEGRKLFRKRRATIKR